MTNNSTTHIFNVAELAFGISFAESEFNGMNLISSFIPFKQEKEENLLFQLYVDDKIRPVPKAQRERIRDVDTGNGVTIVDEIEGGGYQFIIRNIYGDNCCLLITNKDFSKCQCALNGNYGMRAFGLNNALMLIYAFATSRLKTVMIHASLVRNNGRGYGFIAKSGTGKSTHVSLWLKHIPGCDLMNDDNPIIRIIDGEAFIYGSPWSGKTPCYRNVKARLGALTHIDRATVNSIEHQSPLDAFALLLASVSSMKWDSGIYNDICDTITNIIETTPIYILHCRPDREAAEVCHAQLCK